MSRLPQSLIQLPLPILMLRPGRVLPNPAVVSSSAAKVPEPISAYGLVIDYDNAFTISGAADEGHHMNSVRCFQCLLCVASDKLQGTLPYMALESLSWETPEDFKHEPRHDLESLFYVILTLCTYVEKPGHLRSLKPLPQERSICLNSWWAIGDHHELARSKGIALTSFEKYTPAEHFTLLE